MRHVLTVFILLAALTSAPALAQPSESYSRKPERLYLAQSKEQTVYFNTESLKFHAMSCTWAKRCTANCVAIPRSQAIRRGGIPCKVCGGG